MDEEHYEDPADAEYARIEAQQQESDIDEEVFGGLKTMAHAEASKMLGISPVRAPGVSVPNLAAMLAFVKSSQPHELDTLLEHMLVNAGGPEGIISIIKAKSVVLGYESVDAEFNKWTPGMIGISSIDTGEAPPMVWYGIYKRSIILVNGQSGAGKSSAVYNIAIHAAVGKTLWDVPFLAPQRILYVDPENQGGVRSEKLKRIAKSSGIPLEDIEKNLVFHDAAGMDLSDPLTVRHLGDVLVTGEFDGLILDPLANLFGTVNENDNAEASRHMRLLTDLLGRTGAWIMLIHHTGKSEEGGARGASARHGASFVVIDLRLAKEAEDVNDDYDPGKKKVRADLVRFRIVKNRYDGGKVSLFLKMGGSEAEDCFVRMTYDDWMREAKSGAGVTAADQAMLLVREFFDVIDVSRQYVRSEVVVAHIAALGGTPPSSGPVLSAIALLCNDGYLAFEKAGKGGTRYLYRKGLDEVTQEQFREANLPETAKARTRAKAGEQQEGEQYEPELMPRLPSTKFVPVAQHASLEHNDGNSLPLDEGLGEVAVSEAEYD